MAHSHDHDHHHGDNYYLDQVATVAVCGLLAGLGFLIWRTDLLTKYNILTEQFNRPVLLGSIALAGMVILRGATLWSEVGQKKKAHSHDHHHHDHDHGACDHHHKPGEACGHNHDHDHHHHDDVHDHDHGHHHHDHDHGHAHGHSHDHDHDHGFAPWRYAVLLLPLILSGLLLYYNYAGLKLVYSAEKLAMMAGSNNVQIDPGDLRFKPVEDTRVWVPGLRELSDAVQNGRMTEWDGRFAEMRGLFSPIGEREFSLFRLKMTCCAADSVPLKVRIYAADNLKNYGLKPGKGVVVIGQVQFRQVTGSDEIVPIVIAKEIKAADLGNDIYEKGT